MLGLVEVSEYAAVDSRVQCLHPTVEHLGKVRDVAHFEVGDLGLRQGLRGAARRHELDVGRTQSARELDEARLVPHA